LVVNHCLFLPFPTHAVSFFKIFDAQIPTFVLFLLSSSVKTHFEGTLLSLSFGSVLGTIFATWSAAFSPARLFFSPPLFAPEIPFDALPFLALPLPGFPAAYA